jgi:hypothetical protein
MRLNPFLFFVVLIGINGMVEPVAAGEDALSPCPTILVDVGFESERDRALVCAGAAKARAFFRSYGIGLKRRIRLRLHQAEIENRALHIGLYDAEKDQVDLLTFDQAKRQTAKDSLFGMQMDEPLYVSVVVHELAHAIAGQNLEISPRSLTAHEYIAYVAQLSTMEPETRSKICERYESAAYESVGEMSSVYYFLDPSGFGVKAFRHHQALADPGQFVRDLLSGAIEPISTDWE